MKSLNDIRQALRAERPVLRHKFSVASLGICGSYVRDEYTEESDLDLLVTFSTTPDLLDFIALKQHLESTLGLQVDLGTPDAIRGQEPEHNILTEVEYV